MAPVTKPLIDALQQAITFVEKREAPPSGDYFEAVLSREDLGTCCELLAGTFGPAAKEFGKVVRFAGQHQIMVNKIGGIQPDQCLYVKEESSRPVAFAALWPWASNPQRVTLKVGVFPR